MIGRRCGLPAGPTASVAAWVAARAVEPNRGRRRETILLGSAQGSSPDKLAHDFAGFLVPHPRDIDIELRNLPGECLR